VGKVDNMQKKTKKKIVNILLQLSGNTNGSKEQERVGQLVMEGVMKNKIEISKPWNEDPEKEMLKKKIGELNEIVK